VAVPARLHDTEHVRNIALVGHAGAGKTSLLEGLLARTGEIRSAGSIQRGDTVSDHTPPEKQLGHSLETAICNLEYNGVFMNMLDTPGYPDFIGRAMSVLPAVETAAVVINAQAGIELVTRRIMRFAKEQKLCRMIIVNRIDAEGVDLQALLHQVREVFGKECLPLNLPANNASTVADCFFTLTGEATDFSSVASAHTEIVDQVVELDEALMEIYLEQGQEISAEQLHDPFERALRRGHLIPVCFVSAETGAGLNQLLNIFARMMPSPLEANPPVFLKGEGDAAKAVKVSAKAADHFIGHVFKVNVDPYVGKMGAFRVHQGTLRSGDQIFVGDRRKSFKAAHLYRLQGGQTTEIASAVPGDICAIAKIDELQFDSVVHSSHDEDHFHLQSVQLPAPMYGVAVELTRRGDEKKLSDALHKLAAEDPSLVIEFHTQANETILRGMGELHLRLVLERMRDDFGLSLHTHPPKVAYRETITRQADGHHRHKKQTGGAGQFGEVYLRVEPLPRDSGFEFSNKVVGGAIPAQFMSAVEKGVRQVLAEGAVAGYPLQDIRVTVYDGKHHAVDSKEVAFVAAARKALLDAVLQASPLILEPVAHLEVTVSGDSVGGVTGHLAGIRGRIDGSTALTRNRFRVSAQVPVSELDDYQTTLKSMTGGEGSFTLSFDHYAAVPGEIQRRLQQEGRSPGAREQRHG